MILGLLLSAATVLAPQDGERTSWTVHADVVYTASGDPIENAVVRIQDGKIAAIAPGKAKDGEGSLSVACVTPGLVDLSVRAMRKWSSVEHGSEVSPHMLASDAVDLHSEDWLAIARTGVTSALVSPPDFDVIGGRGLAVKTAGGAAGGARALKDDLVLRGSMGSQPSARNHPAFGRPEDLYSRRPTTRMGVEWEHRRAFYEAAASKGDDARAFPGSDQLVRVLDGELPFMVQAWATQDIRTAVFLKEEIEREGLGKPQFILDAAAEAWREPQLLVRSNVAVVLPPFPKDGRTSDGAFMTMECAKLLSDLGVTLALSGHGSTDPMESLPRQAGWARRGGLSLEAALAAVTSTPAKLAGIDDEVGSLEVGKAGDLVLWSGEPFEASSAVIGVLVDGRLVLDPRSNTETVR